MKQMASGGPTSRPKEWWHSHITGGVMTENELNEQQLSHVTGGITPEEVHRIASDTLGQANAYTDQVSTHHGVTIKSRAVSAIAIALTDFGAFTTGGIVADAVVPKKKQGS